VPERIISSEEKNAFSFEIGIYMKFPKPLRLVAIVPNVT
jgi:hypothetical protein